MPWWPFRKEAQPKPTGWQRTRTESAETGEIRLPNLFGGIAGGDVLTGIPSGAWTAFRRLMQVTGDVTPDGPPRNGDLFRQWRQEHPAPIAPLTPIPVAPPDTGPHRALSPLQTVLADLPTNKKLCKDDLPEDWGAGWGDFTTISTRDLPDPRAAADLATWRPTSDPIRQVHDDIDAHGPWQEEEWVNSDPPQEASETSAMERLADLAEQPVRDDTVEVPSVMLRRMKESA